MDQKTNLTRAEIQKKYRQKIKLDPEKYKNYMEKEKTRNAKRKKIEEMSIEQHEHQREQWRDQRKRYYERIRNKIIVTKTESIESLQENISQSRTNSTASRISVQNQSNKSLEENISVIPSTSKTLKTKKNDKYSKQREKLLTNVKKEDRDESSDAEEYVIEKIVDKRIKGGKLQYYLKWEGYGSEYNTWENESGLSCPELIKAFEDCLKEADKEQEISNGSKLLKKKRQISESIEDDSGDDVGSASKQSKSSTSARVKNTTDNVADAKSKTNSLETSSKNEKVISGFAQGFVPEKIIGASKVNNELLFLLKWKGFDKAEMVKAKEANVKCPQLVIQFFEQRLIWHKKIKIN